MGNLVTMGDALNSLALSAIQRNLQTAYPPGDPKRNAILSHIINAHPAEPYTAFLQKMMDPPAIVLSDTDAAAIIGREFMPGDLTAEPPPGPRYALDRLPHRLPAPPTDPDPGPDPNPNAPADTSSANTMLLLMAGAVVFLSMKGGKL